MAAAPNHFHGRALCVSDAERRLRQKCARLANREQIRGLGGRHRPLDTRVEPAVVALEPPWLQTLSNRSVKAPLWSPSIEV